MTINQGLTIVENKVNKDKIKYKTLRGLLQDGDICEFKDWSGNVTIGLFIAGWLMERKESGRITQTSGKELSIVAVRRPRAIRCSFQCFIDAETYNYDISKFGEFKTVYDEN